MTSYCMSIAEQTTAKRYLFVYILLKRFAKLSSVVRRKYFRQQFDVIMYGL